MGDQKSVKMKATVDTSELDEVMAKVEKFNALLIEANSLADELANKNITIKVNTN